MNKTDEKYLTSFIVKLWMQLPNTNHKDFIKSNFIKQFQNIVSYPIKESRYENDVYYYLVVEVDNNEFLDKLNETTNILVDNQKFLIDIGIKEVSEFAIYMTYKSYADCVISCKYLKRLKKLQPSGVSISTDCRDLDEKNDRSVSSEYTQLLFDNIGVNVKKIIRLWQKQSLNEYEGFKYWSKIPTKNQLILNIEDNLDFFKGGKIYNDLAFFVEKNKEYLNDNNIIISFGIHHQNYDGGETGSTIIEKCIELETDLVITKSIYKP